MALSITGIGISSSSIIKLTTLVFNLIKPFFLIYSFNNKFNKEDLLKEKGIDVRVVDLYSKNENKKAMEE